MMRPDQPRWLDVVARRGRDARLVLILQHHIVPASSRIAATLRPAAGRSAELLLPLVELHEGVYNLDPLDLAAMPMVIMGDIVGSALDQADAITDGLDAIFRGHPVGLPVV
jgi:hypothetical protein